MDCIAVEPSNLYECKIGNNVKIGPFVEIQKDAVVGDGCVIGSHTFLCGGIRVGQNVFIGHGVMTCNDKNPVPHNAAFVYEPPIIEDKVSIGSGAIILPGVIIGESAVIGAGAIVTKSVLPGHTIIGIH